MSSERTILTINRGSSSLKFGWFRASASDATELLSGEIEYGVEGGDRLTIHDDRGGQVVSGKLADRGDRAVVGRIRKWTAEFGLEDPVAVGHRLVHGGPHYQEHCLLTEDVLRGIEEAAVFAPNHTPLAVRLIEVCQEVFPSLPQVACFDTAFHQGLPEVARVLPLPRHLEALGVKKFGFHGLSCESIVHAMGSEVPERMVIAHLGNGASSTAVLRGQSVDTTMGLTPMGGQMMGTRSGDLDPGVVLHLLGPWGDVPSAKEILMQRSGMAGVSGTSGDMRALSRAAETDRDARLAIEMFCYSAAKHIAGLFSVLDGADMLVFAGGIGEHSAETRSAICRRLRFLGVRIDESRNSLGQNPLSAEGSTCRVLVVPSQENKIIAIRTASLAGRQS